MNNGVMLYINNALKSIFIMNVIYILQNSYFLCTKNEQLKLGNKIFLGAIRKKKFHYLQFFSKMIETFKSISSIFCFGCEQFRNVINQSHYDHHLNLFEAHEKKIIHLKMTLKNEIHELLEYA